MKKSKFNLPVTAVDIFCGIGGLTYGLKKAGIDVKAGIDSDKSCKYAYEKNNKTKFIYKDIREIKAKEIKNLYGKNDFKVLVGCAPCQPFSTHTQKVKNRKNREDWGLLYYFLDLIKKVRPHIVSMENVVQIKKYDIFTDFVNGLEGKGYKVKVEKVFCPEYGIPQNRRRLVLLASRLGEIKLKEPTHGPTNYKTVRDALARLKKIKHGEFLKKDIFHRAAKLSPINYKRIKVSKPGGSWRDWNKDLVAKCHREDTGGTYGSVYARMEWDKPSPTITTQFYRYGTGRFGHPKQDRAISIREGAILQTFPKKYKLMKPREPMSLTQLGKHVGNAVPVKLGEVIGKSILNHLEVYCGERTLKTGI